MRDPTRRAVLAAASAAALSAPRPAGAAGQIVVATWGGDYANLLRANVDDPLMTPQGSTVVQDTGDEDPRVAKLFAQRRLPRGAADVVCLQAVRAHEVDQAGLLEPLDATKVPNLAHAPAEPADCVLRPAHLQPAGHHLQSRQGAGPAAHLHRPAGPQVARSRRGC